LWQNFLIEKGNYAQDLSTANYRETKGCMQTRFFGDRPSFKVAIIKYIWEPVRVATNPDAAR